MSGTVLSLNVAVFCNPSPPSNPQESLAERLDAEVTRKSPTVLAIEQERLSFDVAPPLEIQRDYPQYQDIDRLAQATNAWTDLVTEPDSIQSVIFRIERTYSPDWDTDEVVRVLGQKVLAPDLPFSSWEVYGGMADIFYKDEQDRMWSFNIQPRVPDPTKLYLGASLLVRTGPNFATEEVARTLQDVWANSLLFLEEVSGA